jgi:hypothetical protein
MEHDDERPAGFSMKEATPTSTTETATYPRDRIADVVIDGGTPHEARLQDGRPT